MAQIDTDKPRGERLVKIRIAARLKAEGLTWEEVAEELGYSSGSSAQSAIAGGKWRDEWHKAVEAEYMIYYLQEREPFAMEAEVKLIRRFIDSDDHKKALVAQRAAHSVLTFASKLRKQIMDVRTEQAKSQRADERLIEQTERQLETLKELAEGAGGES